MLGSELEALNVPPLEQVAVKSYLFGKFEFAVPLVLSRFPYIKVTDEFALPILQLYSPDLVV